MTSIRRHARRSWPTALAIATAANLTLLALLAFPGRYQVPLAAETGRPVDISMAHWPVPNRPAPRKAAASAASAAVHPATPPSPAIAPAGLSAPQSSEQPSGAASPNDDLAAALRGGPVGCAHQDAAWMTDAGREACRHQLAIGAASTPYRQGMAPAKLAYYAAVAQAEEDWRSGRNPGHLPYLGCTPGRSPPPHALKIGPCFIDPPQGSLDQDVDVPSP